MSGPDAAVPKAVIFGCAGQVLSEEERALFASARPLGFILFGRNCATPDQLRRLIHDLRDCVDDASAPVLIDQEGGRVARLGPPHWRRPPPMQVFADLHRRDPGAAREACRLNARLIGAELAALGITVDCAPVCDVPQPGSHDIIGDRALGRDADTVAALGQEVCDGLLAEGVLPVIKHVPGHGRARADSHLELPEVDAGLDALRATDFAPFRALANAPWAMTAHVVYTAVDAERPASTSRAVIDGIVRKEIGFGGFLVSDDLGMKALSGTEAEKVEAVIAAGCDAALHCSGVLTEMREAAAAAPPLSDAARERLAGGEARRLTARAAPEPDPASRLDTLLRTAAGAGLSS